MTTFGSSQDLASANVTTETKTVQYQEELEFMDFTMLEQLLRV
jgi:hypothetical protein